VEVFKIIPEDILREVIGPCTEIEKFKKSGQKDVSLIQHEIFGRVVLKVVVGDLRRILREIKIVQENEFTNVPKIFLSKEILYEGNECLILIEEFVSGQTLESVLQSGKLETQKSLKMLSYLLDVCEQFEAKGIVHRDIKPGNIIVGDDGEFYLIDFGIARVLRDGESLTQTGAIIGPHTPGYAPPEFINYDKKSIDSRSDLFSIGVVVYECLTGENPFTKDSQGVFIEIWHRTLNTHPDRTEIEGDYDHQISGLIHSMMQPLVTRRPPSAKEANAWFKAMVRDLL
jgi:serine/threonine-protein kinase